MKTIIKEILDELINYVKDDFKMPEKHFKKVTEKMSVRNYAFPFLHIIGWMRNIQLDLLDEDENSNFFIIESQVLDSEWKNIYKYASILNEVLIKDKEKILWNPELTEKNIKGITKYVAEHYNPKIRVYLDPKKTQ
ncbi:hypothetical protein [Kordia sp.]|uniref:hypothetical protein n=1 Tax=Kordia sp. TaxID=1965332 RepID=UPI003D6B958C